MTLAVSDAIAALLAGNAVVIKPDSQTPYCALACAELLYQAGLPRELFAVVPGPGSVVGTALVENTDYLMFTGSTATGRLLAEQAGRRLIGFSAELGGKNPMIVAKGANLREVTDAAVRACFSNSGQLCISVERIYVEEAIAPEFIRQFGERVRNMTLAPGYEFGIEMGSLVSEDQVKTVSGHVDDAVAKGATVVAGGKARPDLGPLFYEPTVLTGSRPRWSATRTRRSGHWWRSTRSPTSRRPSRAPTTPTTGSTRAYGRAATPRARPSRPASWRAPSTSTRATAPPGAAPPPRWAAWGCRASAAATAPRSAQVHGGADRRDHQGGQSRWSAVAAGQGLGQAVAALHQGHEVRAGTLTRPPIGRARPRGLGRSFVSHAHYLLRGDSTH